MALNDTEQKRQWLCQRQRELLARTPAPAATPAAPVAASGHCGSVAIIGMHGRLPGADSIAAFWQNLEREQRGISEIPADRFDWREYYDPESGDGGKMRTRWGGFIVGIDRFDYEFFGILPAEAELIDPQQRLLLMSVYHTLENAGYASGTLKGSRTGVYVAAEDNEFLQRLKAEGIDLGLNGFNHHPSMMANRISYYFDFRGPSEVVNTMCASAAVAVHKACTAIVQGEIDLAVVGAARLILQPEPLIGLSRMKMLSGGDSVKSFGAEADGYLRAEGIGSILLKALPRAEADRDHIYAVVKGGAINFNGRGGMSIAAPNREAHIQVIAQCYERAGVDPAHIDYIEVQGMGNQVGDIAEWEACNRALEQLSEARGQQLPPGACAVSTLKPMIGHMECASALGALFKIIGSFTHNRLYGIPGLDSVNPYLVTEGRPCCLLQHAEPWNPKNRPRLAGLHSYGSGGNNAHLLIEEYKEHDREASVEDNRDRLYVVSAKDKERLPESLRMLVEHLRAYPQLPLDDVAWTLLCGRNAFECRLAIVANSLADLIGKAQVFLRGENNIDEVFIGNSAGEKTPQHSAFSETSAAADPLSQAAHRWIAGERIDPAEAGIGERAGRVGLPGYPFRPLRCWPFAQSSEPGADAPASIPGAGKRICVVGAGPAGLVMAKSLLEEGHIPCVLEKQSDLGGLWLLDENRAGGAYKKVRFQSSRFTSVFSDFYADDIDSVFYSVEDVKRYLDGYAERFGLRGLIRFNSEVVSVEQKGDRWQVTATQNGREETAVYDGVALCQGGFWKENIPQKPGFERFRGEVLHSGRYFENSIFRDKRVLVVGNGVSAMDIAEEAAAVARRVVWSRRSTKLILPRMVGFVPNDCQSPASLLVESNRTNIIQRLRESMPEYYELYERSGLLPTQREFEANPIVHINDNIVALVADGRIAVAGDVGAFRDTGCTFLPRTDAAARSAPQAAIAAEDFDIVMFCTGYRDFASESGRFGYVKNIDSARDFSMGIFYHRNPSLVNTSVLPIAYTGSFYFMEMVARWYARIMSGSYRLSREEIEHRVTADHYLIMAPISNVLFGLKLGLFPRPETEFGAFWKLFNYPAFPMLNRLRGPHAYDKAEQYLEDFRRKSFVKTDSADPELKKVKLRLLAGLGRDNLDYLLARGEISAEEFQQALAFEGEPLTLDWESQYIKKSDALKSRHGDAAGTGKTEANAGGRLREGLTALMADILRIAPAQIQPRKNFSEYGFDSITLTGFAGKIIEAYPFISLSPTTFLEHPTLEDLAGHLTQKYAGHLQAEVTEPENGNDKKSNETGELNREPCQEAANLPPAVSYPAAHIPTETKRAADIAIIGVGGRFPGAADAAAFWRNLMENTSAITRVPASRWDWRDYDGDPACEPGKTDCHYGAFIEAIDCFDSLHFGIAPREARFMDPQHRLLLEAVWETVENAGYSPEALRDTRTGFFVGVEKQEYVELIRTAGIALDGYMNTGNAHSMLANRVSHFFSWKGPSLAVDTACAGSFSALDLAVDQLQAGKIEQALAGGVNVSLTPALFILNRQLGMLTHESKVKPFDAEAGGQLNGEGLGLVFLKTLARAERDNDCIHAVIKGCSVRHGGKSVYLMAPNPSAHREVIEEALKKSGLSAGDIDHIEAQGAGHPLTDSMELKLYNRIFSGASLGTLKGHIGHLGSASGVVALIKSALACKNNIQPGILNLNTLNWDSNDGELNITPLKSHLEWPCKQGLPRRIAVHNYGYGGVTAHVILEEYIERDCAPAPPPIDSLQNVFILSSGSEAQLLSLAGRFIDYLENKDYAIWGVRENILQRITYTLQTGRAAMPYRMAIVTDSPAALLEQLRLFVADPAADSLAARSIYTGVADERRALEWDRLINDAGREFLIESCRRKGDVERLALLWVKGIDPDWQRLYNGAAVRKMPLPAYPFLRERHWIENGLDPVLSPESGALPALAPVAGGDSVMTRLLAMVSDICMIGADKLSAASRLDRLGLDSLMRMQLLDKIEREFSVRIELADFNGLETVATLAKLVSDTVRSVSVTPRRHRELELLSRGRGIPVFWFHGALGTVQNYIPVARGVGSGLTFYGVQNRALKDSSKPVDNLRALGQSYSECLLNVHGNQPFHLGGYSQGGALAYEVARVLQERGATVKSLVLVDTPFAPVETFLSEQMMYVLAFANILQLDGKSLAHELPELLRETGGESYIERALTLAGKMGLHDKRTDLTAALEKFFRIVKANTQSMQTYTPAPLPWPQEPECHYFQRRSKAGFFPPAFAVSEEIKRQNAYFGANACAQKWRALLPSLQVHATDAEDHFSMLEHDESLAKICATCRLLYCPEIHAEAIGESYRERKRTLKMDAAAGKENPITDFKQSEIEIVR